MIDRAYQRQQRPLLARVDVIPYIDVMLVLVAIFLMTAPFLVKGHIPLPRLTHAHTVPAVVVRLTLYDAEHVEVAVGDEVRHYTTHTVLPVLQQLFRDPHHASAHCLLAAAPTLSYGLVMRFLDQLQKSGILHVGLLVQAEHLS